MTIVIGSGTPKTEVNLTNTIRRMETFFRILGMDEHNRTGLDRHSDVMSEVLGISIY